MPAIPKKKVTYGESLLFEFDEFEKKVVPKPRITAMKLGA